VVNTAASGNDHRILRNTIRETWGKSIATRNKTWKVFFALGMVDNQNDNEANLQEALTYNDVIIGNFTDKYINLVIKTFMSHYWASTKLSCSYVLKTDDDVYVRIPGLIKWLVKSGSPQSLYGGYISPFHVVPRDPCSKWYISREQYSEHTWPPFCHGAYHVLSSNIIAKYLNYTHIRRPFHADDAYIGVASNDLGINAIQIPGFKVDLEVKERTNWELITSFAIGHKLDSKTIIKYHHFYKTFWPKYSSFLSP